jgi:RimJ/RimL family protein N-acetyltransferase
VEIVSWAERPDPTRAMHEVSLESAPDQPNVSGYEPEPFEDWLATEMSGPDVRPDGVFVALGDGEAVGIAVLRSWTTKPDLAYHDLTGVRRAWRGRGAAGALKATQIRWAKEVGFTRLRTRNEPRNEPIRRLNERYGCRLVAGEVVMRGPISSP